MTDYKESPFRPGYPAPPEIFVGRDNEISSITRYINQNSKGLQKHVFLIGDRGIGKSSLASYVMNIARKRNQMVGIHIILDGAHDTKTLVKQILETILNEVRDEKWHKKVWNLFKDNVESAGVASFNIKFSPTEEDLMGLTRQFPETLKKIIDTIKDEKNGIFIIIDDINGLTEDPDFANWYKSFVDTVATTYPKDFPVFMMLVGLPEKRTALYKHNRSFMRIFHIAHIEPLERSEVEEFFSRTFNDVSITVDDDALDIMVQYSSGMPTMMHEIGDAVFWLCDGSDVIDMNKALEGVLQAGDVIGRKYLEPSMINIQSKTYRKILVELGKRVLIEFSVRDLKNILDEEEHKSVPSFVKRCKDLGIIVAKSERGTYKFANNLYPVYFSIMGNK